MYRRCRRRLFLCRRRQFIHRLHRRRPRLRRRLRHHRGECLLSQLKYKVTVLFYFSSIGTILSNFANKSDSLPFSFRGYQNLRNKHWSVRKQSLEKKLTH